MPTIQIPEKLQRILTTKARFIVLIGGRSSAKSETMGRVVTMKVRTEGADVLCGREYQNSIDDSVHKLIKGIIEKLYLKGFNITENKIDNLLGSGTVRFKGFARNSDAVKSAQNFKYSWIEEAQSLSQKSIDDLLPTIRATGSQLFFTANPQSSGDPFSKRFIVPYINELLRDGIYEDELHLIIMCNWRDNPWHGELEAQRQWDYQNYTRAKYNWIWEGAFNDSVEDPLILAEWFDACIDAHKVLGWDQPKGIIQSSHDPSDQGEDPKSYAMRHGSVLLDLRERDDCDINTGCDWATGLAIQHNADAFTWDCDGLGAGLNRQVIQAFKGKKTVVVQYKGSEAVDHPEAIFQPADVENVKVQTQKKNKEALRNKRAQYYFVLRDKVYRTYKAINGEYHNPDDMISFDSSIDIMSKFRSELCRMPIKPNRNGFFELYTKQEMKDKFKFPSPNLADAVKMLGRVPVMDVRSKPFRPKPLGSYGITSGTRRGSTRLRIHT